jgi:tRNA pseudouridine55 synthase
MEYKYIDGLIIVDKPKGWTSHDVVAKLRSTLKIKKIGHGGTLDPEATGVLIVLLGNYTKRANEILGLPKSYRVSAVLGQSTITGDAEGEITDELEVNDKRLESITEQDITNVLNSFVGTIRQQVPWYSAIKVDGKKLYQLARGKTPDQLQQLEVKISRPVREIEIYSLKLISFEHVQNSYPVLQFEVSCSSGTYTRVLVEDIGKALGMPAFQTELRRLTIGTFDLKHSLTQEEFTEMDKILPKIRQIDGSQE